MPWGDLDPQKAVDMVERYLGRFIGRNLVRLAIFAVLLWVIGYCLLFFFRDFIVGYVWSSLSHLFGNTGEITLDNVDAIIAVLVASLLTVVGVFVFLAYVVGQAFKRRVMAQKTIDQLSDLRAVGIEYILNAKYMRPRDEMTDDEKDELIKRWNDEWKSWRKDVEEFLQENATHAEYMSFKYLGVILVEDFPGIALTNEHAHWLMFLSKQLNILENLIAKHQERL